jgi:putative nucleotidyltransferase with HDIG domain
MKDGHPSVSDSAINILVVDDDQDIREIIQRTIEFAGFHCLTATNGREALEILETSAVAVVLTDIKMPDLNGIELTKMIKERHRLDVIVMTGYAEGVQYEQVIEAGASDFVKKPISPKEIIIRLKRVIRERHLLAERNKAHSELKKSLEKLGLALDQTVNALASTVEMKDPYTSGHQRRVTQIACAVAEEMGLTHTQVDGIRIAGLLHDIGKISVPSEILSKPGKLTAAEFNLLKDHPRMGHDILKGIEFPWPISNIVIQHHEHIDGSGYPSGLTGSELLLEAKIVCVADVVEAMSSHRPYRPSLGIGSAIEEIKKNRGIHYDADIVDVVLKLFREKGFTIE